MARRHLIAQWALMLTGLCLSACATPTQHAVPHSSAPQGTTYRLYFMGGQSNMEGFGYTKDIPADARATPPKVMIFQGRMAEDGKEGGGVGVWQPLTLGHGTGFATDGKTVSLSDRFGPEWAFGQELARLDPDTPIAIVKYTRGGSALVHGVSGYGSWDPSFGDGQGINQYDNALSTIGNAMMVGDIDGDGLADRLIPSGIIWMQGEADAFDNAPAATAYQRNLTQMMGLLRAALGGAELPVVIGQIKDSGDTPEIEVMHYDGDVRAAQRAFVDGDRCAALVTVTDGFGFLPDGWHYRSADYVTLGRAFATEAFALQQRCGPAERP